MGRIRTNLLLDVTDDGVGDSGAGARAVLRAGDVERLGALALRALDERTVRLEPRTRAGGAFLQCIDRVS
jgi:hypothetical protein